MPVKSPPFAAPEGEPAAAASPAELLSADNGGVSDHELLQALLETLPESVFFKDLKGRYIRVSRALARKAGRANPRELIGLTDFDRFTAEHAKPAYENEQRIIRTGQAIVDLEEKETWQDGRVTWVSSTKLPLRDRRGQIVGTFGISRDITERKLAEQENRELQLQLQLAQKLESIGPLAAGIAHEVNTPNQFITDNTRFLEGAFAQLTALLKTHRALPEAAVGQPALAELAQAAAAAEKEQELDDLLEDIPKTIRQTLDGLSRVARIVRSLKEFSHPGDSQRAPST